MAEQQARFIIVPGAGMTADECRRKAQKAEGLAQGSTSSDYGPDGEPVLVKCLPPCGSVYEYVPRAKCLEWERDAARRECAERVLEKLPPGGPDPEKVAAEERAKTKIAKARLRRKDQIDRLEALRDEAEARRAERRRKRREARAKGEPPPLPRPRPRPRPLPPAPPKTDYSGALALLAGVGLAALLFRRRA
jgi:hypothetical protein